jgi:D-arabinose 1-dehydrogenase-like Zn-dependent alcohol dehydrogenase
MAMTGRLDFSPMVTTYPLEEANRALAAVKHETSDGSTVIVP